MKQQIAKRVQWLRIIVQISFLTAVILGVSTKLFSSWLLPAALLIGVFFCGWVCPLGSTQDWMWKLGRLLRLPQIHVPQRAQRYLQLSRYVFYFLAATWSISFALLKGPHNFNRLLHGDILTAASGVVGLFLIVSLFVKRPFCNYFCTGGARQGLWSVLRIFSIKRDTGACGNCGQCTRACPMNIDVANTEFVRHPNCIGCMSCIAACRKGCLSYGKMPALPGKKNKQADSTARDSK
ncbi:MAG: 4Fe-4S binding protein [Akkermansia sp.]|nr:4Fe-4S binding protein [Akkermansia sp.]